MTLRVWWVVLAALLLGAGGGWLVGAQREAQRAAADQATLASYRQTIASLEARGAQLDTVYRRDTVRLTAWRTRWDSVRVTDRFTDTLIQRDTVLQLIRVAESTLGACTDALATCDQRHAVLRSIVAADSAMIRALSREVARAKIRGRLACVIGGAGTSKGLGLGAGCGLRLF